MKKDYPWLTGKIIEEAEQEWQAVSRLLKKNRHFIETSPLTVSTLLASCIIPGQAIKIIAQRYPEAISLQQKKTAGTYSLVTNADHFSQTLADSIMVGYLENNPTLDAIYFNAEEAKTTEYQHFFSQKKYQAYFTLSSHAQYSLNRFYRKKTNFKNCTYLSNLDPLDGTVCFKKWLQTQKIEDARWTVAHTFSEIVPDGRIKPLVTVVHNPVIHKTYFLERTSNTYIVIDSCNDKVLALTGNQDKIHRLIISSKPQDKTLQSIDNIFINELTDHQTIAHRYSEAGSIFDTCEAVDPESPVTCTYSLAVGGLHDLHIPLWGVSASVNLLCPQLKPLGIKLNEAVFFREYAFAFGSSRDVNLFKNPKIRCVCNGRLRYWHDEKLRMAGKGNT